MPANLVENFFSEIFGTLKLRFNESTVFALGYGSISELRADVETNAGSLR